MTKDYPAQNINRSEIEKPWGGGESHGQEVLKPGWRGKPG